MSTEQKGFGTKIKRLFLEEGEAPPETAAGKVAQIAQEAAQEPPPPQGAPAPPVDAAKVDFSSIYKAAGLSDEDLEQVERAENLLRTLPASLPLETQKQIIEGTLKTFGIDPARIRQTIQREQRSLVAYATVVRQDAEKRDAESHARIEALRAEAMKLEHSIEERGRARASVELACKTQSDSVGRMVEFLPAATESK
jgi:hypothetical protein